MKPVIEYIKSSAFTLKLSEKKELLLPYIKEEHLYHYQNNSLYKKIIDNEYQNQDFFTSLDKAPFLPVQYFKENGKSFTSSKKIHRSLLSSSTSGVPSVINIDNETSKRQVFSLIASLSNFIGKERRHFLICDVPPQTNSFDISARHGAIGGFTNFATKSDFILENSDNSYKANIQKIKDIISENKNPLILCGFTFLVYIYLIKFCKQNNITLTLPENSYLIHIGGWKKLADQQVSREKFIEDTCEVFKLKPENIIDIYGFTEQMGTIYPECRYGFKHVPDHAHLIVRNPYSYDILPDGQTGVGQFLSLVPRSYTGFSLITDDLIQITGNDDCKCGRKGTYFKVIGRAKSAEIRGCGDVIATKILEKNSFIENKEQAILYYFESKKTFTHIDNWQLIELQLNTAQQKLAKLSTDEIIGIFKKAAKIWSADSDLIEYKYAGMDFIINWILSGSFEQNLNLSLRGSKHHLDEFIFNTEYNKKLIALPRGIVTHWVAGNVPTLGIISILISIICKNANIIKISKNSLAVLQKMLNIISEIDVKTLNGKKIKGKDITDAICLLYVDRNSENNKSLSKISDVRVAWGGKEAVESIVNFPKKYNAEDIVFGPKLSLSAIGRESMELERKVNRIARSIAIDCSIFDQKACASSHNVFIEKGAKISTETFLSLLKNRMEEISIQIIGNQKDFNAFDKIKSARLCAYQNKKIQNIITSTNMKWTIFFDKEVKLNDPVYGRTIFVHEIEDLSQIADLLSSDNQVVGLELKSFRRDKIAKLFLQKGVSRIAPIGHMADFTLPWDDSFPTEKLIRWCYA